MEPQFDPAELVDGFYVGDWLVEPMLNRLSHGDKSVSMEPKVMEVLVCMARRPGEPVTKSFFMEAVWGGTVVTDDVLSRCISELRKAFGDSSREPRFIETIRKTGYRLIAPVRPSRHRAIVSVQTPYETPLETPSASPDSGPARRWDSLRDSWQSVVRALGMKRALATVLVTLAAVSVAAYLWGRFTANPSGEEPRAALPFTSFPGLEIDPVVAPDGNQIAFAWDGNAGRDFDIFIKQFGAETPLRITDTPGDERWPAWSPDGLNVAFAREDSGRTSIFTIPSIGGTENKIVDFGMRHVAGVTWSPAGNALAVSAEDKPGGAPSIYLVGLDSVVVRRLTRPPDAIHGDLRPSFSPDGSRIAFSRAVTTDIQDLFVVSTGDSSELSQVTFDSTAISGSTWFGDSKSIAFASRRTGSWALWRVSRSGGEPALVAAAPEGTSMASPSMSRTGETLAYVQGSENANIWQLRRSPSALGFAANPLLASTRWESNPAISPSGDRIAYASNQSGSYEIWLSDRDGANLMQRTSLGGGFTGTPAWSPDGTRIAFVSRPKGSSSIYVLDIVGGPPRRLTDSAGIDMAPSWSRDGTSVYFGSNRSGTWQIWNVPAAGGDPEQITVHGGLAARESTDGQWLFYVHPDTIGIWRVAVESSPLLSRFNMKIVHLLREDDWGNFHVTPGGIYFVRRSGRTPVLSYYSHSSRQITTVATLKNVPGHPSLAIAPDENWVLYTQLDMLESDILVIRNGNGGGSRN